MKPASSLSVIRSLGLAALLLPVACATDGSGKPTTDAARSKLVLPLDAQRTPEELIAELYPGSTIRAQAPAQSGKKRFNLFTIDKKDGEVAEVWFLLPEADGDMKLELKPKSKDPMP